MQGFCVVLNDIAACPTQKNHHQRTQQVTIQAEDTEIIMNKMSVSLCIFIKQSAQLAKQTNVCRLQQNIRFCFGNFHYEYAMLDML